MMQAGAAGLSEKKFLTRRLSGFEILNNATLIFLKNIYDNFPNFS